MQRERILKAMVETVAERRFQDATITHVVARAGVSSLTFRELFGDLQTCFLEVLDRMMANSVEIISEAFEREPSWSDGILAGLAALLVLLDSEPHLARVCLLEAPAAGLPALRSRARSLSALQPLLEAGSSPEPGARDPSALLAEAIIGSVDSMLRTRLATGKAPPFIRLLDSLAQIVLMPYLDAPSLAGALSRVELIAQEISQRRLAVPSGWRAGGLPAALRTPRAHRARAVVRYLAAHPRASNRQIAAGVGIAHIGQTSQLLARLQREGLLDKRPGKAGRPNAWTLSERGEQALPQLGEGW